MENYSMDFYLLPILRVMKDNKIWRSSDLADFIAENLKLTSEMMAEKIPSGSLKWRDNVKWALVYLKKAELVKAVKYAHYQITEEGIKVANSDLESIDRKYLQEHYSIDSRGYKKGTEKKEEKQVNFHDEEVLELTPIQQLFEINRSIREDVCAELLESLKSGTPAFFEKVVVDVIQAMGYGVGEVTQLSHDGGIDGIIKEDKLGLDKIYIQAKRYTEDSVDRPEVQKFSGAMDSYFARKGIFVTTSSFSKGARDFKPLDKNIVLIDGKQLSELMYDYNVGVSTTGKVEIKKIDSDYFEE